MARTRQEPAPPLDRAHEWPKLVVRVPPEWKRLLDEAARARAMSVAALIRQCIRTFVIDTRPDREKQ